MTHQPFNHLFEGPFVYVPGRNGVDATFDVTCTRTHAVVTYASYWHERENAEAVAYAITHALNRHYRPIRSRFKRTDRIKLRQFQKLHPGPYSVLVIRHSPGHCEIGVTDVHTATLLVGDEAAFGDPECIAYFEWIASMLNKTFGHVRPAQETAYESRETDDVLF